MHPLVEQYELVRHRIQDQKRAMRQIRIRLGMDAAELSQLEAQIRALGLGFRSVPVTRGVEVTHGQDSRKS